MDTLKTQLDVAWNRIVGSNLYRRAQAEATVAFRELREPPRIYQRLDELTDHLFETAALLADDDIQEMLTTIANEKDEKMTEYRLPKELEDGPLWNSRGDMWTRLDSNIWVHDESGIVSSWLALLVSHGPLTDTPPIKEGDTGLTAEQVWDLPKGTVIWPERAEVPEPWLRLADGCGWESLSDEAFDAGSLQCVCGDGFTVLRLGGGE